MRIFNYVRIVRATSRNEDTVGDGIPDWWRRQYFGGSGTTTNASSGASSDPDGDGMSNLQEYMANTEPSNGASRLAIVGIADATNAVRLTWSGGTNAWQYVESSPTLGASQWTAIFTNAPPTPVTNTLVNAGGMLATSVFYRINVHL